MKKDFRKEFDQLQPLIRKRLIIQFVLAVGYLPYIILMISLFNPTAIIVKLITIIYLLLFSCVSIWWLLRIKCPNCNKSLYVYKYILNIPVLITGIIKNHCPHCKEKRGRFYLSKIEAIIRGRGRPRLSSDEKGMGNAIK